MKTLKTKGEPFFSLVSQSDRTALCAKSKTKHNPKTTRRVERPDVFL